MLQGLWRVHPKELAPTEEAVEKQLQQELIVCLDTLFNTFLSTATGKGEKRAITA